MKKAGIHPIHKQQAIADLHDRVMNNLDCHHKKGVRELLERNVLSFKKVLYPYLLLCGVKDIKELMNAIDGVLELHTKECYTIGYIDAIEGRLEK